MSRLSKRYAKALFSLTLDEKKLDVVSADISLLSTLLTESADLAAFIVNPLTNSMRQQEIIEKSFSNKLSDIVLNFLMLLARKKRLNILADIIVDYNRLILVHNNQIHAEVFSNSSLTDGQISKIKQRLEKLTHKQVLIKTSLDDNLIGGFTIRVEDIIIDNSIRYQLAKLKDQLVA